MKRKTADQAIVEPTATVPSRTDMLEAFVELVGEEYGYFMARRLTQQEMAEKTETETKAVREKAKQLSENVESYLDAPVNDQKVLTDLKGAIKANQKDLADLRKKAADARKPFMEKIKPLAQAQKFIYNVAIPDALKELGRQVAPQFSLSKWITTALENQKNKKNKAA